MYVPVILVIILVYFLILIDNGRELFETEQNSSIVSLGNNELRLTNVLNTITKLEVDTGISCNSQKPCIGDNIHCSSSECVKKPPGTFYELLEKPYMNSNTNGSYMEILDVDSLNIKFQFGIVFKKLGNYCIVRSGLDSWELNTHVSGNNIMVHKLV